MLAAISAFCQAFVTRERPRGGRGVAVHAREQVEALHRYELRLDPAERAESTIHRDHHAGHERRRVAASHCTAPTNSSGRPKRPIGVR